ncbi:MAG TPA: SulP family inorganic anion transporter [Pyrinomonadaceae bacterium]|nr:SulP family inorganic anion transporter [Pyrinomonadaceae bacterium]
MTIAKLLPGIDLIRTYRREWFSNDLVAGLSLAAVALPIGIAYAQLAGFPPVVGIYSCILPAVAYALFGSSRQLVVNPDAAACSIVAATVTPLAAGNALRYAELSIVLTVMTGVLCIAGGLAGFGVIANFLSRPILTGYLNGIALTIIAGQLGALFGFKVSPGGFFHTVVETVSRLNETHIATFALGATLLVLILLLKRLTPRIPSPLVAAAFGAAAVFALSLNANGVTVVGAVPAGFPAPTIPAVNTSEISPLLFGAIGIALVSFCSMMTTARGFAAKNGYRINVNQDLFALGVSDLASAFNRGFVVSGADSRTAVADASGGKSQMASIFAALVMAVVLIFLTGPLAYVPTAALAAILISSALGLFDWGSLRRYYHLSKPEFRHSVIAMLGVMTLGVLRGVLIAVALALLNLLRHASHPRDKVLGLIEDDGEIYTATEDDGGTIVPGLIIYRFESALVFFNADYFTDRVRTLIRNADAKPRRLLFDAESVPVLDVSGAYAIDDLRSELKEQGIMFGIAGAGDLFRIMLERAGVAERIGSENLFHTVHAGAESFRRNGSAAGLSSRESRRP